MQMYGENAVLSNRIEKTNELSDEKEIILHRSLTKQMIRILLLLLSGTMTNKEIAEKMNLSASALSNILLRMKKCEIELLTITRKDKNVLYSLSPIAREYAKKNLLKNNGDDTKLIRINEVNTVEYQMCKESLNVLKEKLGEDWEADFFECCIEYYKYNHKENVMPEAANFFENMEELVIKGQDTQLELMWQELGIGGFKKKYQEYINKFIYIRILCNLDAEAWKLAYQFVDEMMSGEEIRFSYDFMVHCELGKEDILNMSNGLLYIVNCSKDMKLLKKGFLEHWSKYFGQHERLLYYIAEKYVNKCC